jgi:translation initiation factor IF-2
MKEENIRINKILRKLDISLKRAVDFLNSKNIHVQESPNAKVGIHACKLLVNQFCLDNSLKIDILSSLLDNEDLEVNEQINNYSRLVLKEPVSSQPIITFPYW